MYATEGPGRRFVRFGWLGESWQVFSNQAGIWIVGALIYGVITLVVVYGTEIAIMFPMMFSMGPGAVPADPTVMMRSMMPRAMLVGIVVGLLVMVINAFFWGGLLKVANNQLRGYPVSMGDVFQGGKTFLRLLGFQLIFYIPLMLLSWFTTFPMTMHFYSAMPTTSIYDPLAQLRAMAPVYAVGLLYNLVPVVLFGLFWPAAAVIADGVPVIDAIVKSWNAMKGSWLFSALFMLVFFIIMGVTAVFCLMPLLVTVPMLIIISSLMYRDMVGMPPGDAPPMPAYLYQPPPGPQSGVWPPPPSQTPPDNPPRWPGAQ